MRKCYLCSSGKSTITETDLGWTIACPCCGKYWIAREVQEGRRSPDDLFKMACIAHEWHLANRDGHFMLVDDQRQTPLPDEPASRIFTPSEMLAAFPSPVDLLDRVLLNLSRLMGHPMAEIRLMELPFACFFTAEKLYRNTIRCMAASGLVDQSGSPVQLRILPKGWERVHELSGKRVASEQVFVAMWFDASREDFWTQGIDPAVRSAGYRPARIDVREHNNKICDEIIAEIRRSKFVVADFTAGKCRNEAACDGCEHQSNCTDKVRQRGGVYYEAGFAQGLGLDVIWMVDQAQGEAIHFDIRQYNQIRYASPADLQTKLRNRILATIGQGPVKPAD